MFERFTEKAINAVIEAQRFAKEFKSPEVCPEHLLLALVSEAKGVPLKIFRMYNINVDVLQEEVGKYIISNSKTSDNINFSHSLKEILKKTLDLASKSGNQNILFEHLLLAVISDKNSNISSVIEHFNFDVTGLKEILNKLVQKKIKKIEHPEGESNENKTSDFEAKYKSEALTEILDSAVSKTSAAGYEILGTEQIVASILEYADENLIKILNDNGVNLAVFEEKLSAVSSRQSEYEGKKIIFTPNAFLVINQALETAKELGSPYITPEHIILSILKTKKGLAYEIIKSININENKLFDEIIVPIEKQMPETLMIMKLAKEETRRIGRNVVGTEMLLLGILGEGASVASQVLNDLEINLKDARMVVENMIGFGNEYFDKEIVFTNRAKHVLEKAWLSAKNNNKQKIEAVDLLLAITEETDSVAMKALSNLGVDVIEIKQGIQGIKNRD